MARVTVILFDPVIEHMKSWDGDIGRSVLTLCRHIRTAQRQFAPVRTGMLKRSIEIGTLGRSASGISTSVGANPGQTGRYGYAYYQEVSTRAHPIFAHPDNATGGFMVFFWAKVGRVVWFRKVNHPGHRGTHWAMKGADTGMATWS